MNELLEWLNSLENCIAKDLWGKEIPLRNINHLKNVKHLDISSNWIKNLHKNLFELNLLSLDCSYCSIDELSIISNSIQAITISDCEISKIQIISESLDTLDISNNCLESIKVKSPKLSFADFFSLRNRIKSIELKTPLIKDLSINENIIFDQYCETYEILKNHDKKPIIKQNSKVSDKIF